MTAESISSRKNQYIVHLRSLAADGAYRREHREYVCDGMKLLDEALSAGAELLSVLWRERPGDVEGLEGVRQYTAPAELFDYASPMKNSPGPLFTLHMPDSGGSDAVRCALALENVQDPGNVGTVIRSAKAFGIDAVVLCGDCADLYSPKTARATMGAVFSQRVLWTDAQGLASLAQTSGLPLYGAALSTVAEDIRRLDVKNAIVAVGSEGRGLSEELLGLCHRRVIIPMCPGSESLNAAAAATVIMWEMAR